MYTLSLLNGKDKHFQISFIIIGQGQGITTKQTNTQNKQTDRNKLTNKGLISKINQKSLMHSKERGTICSL